MASLNRAPAPDALQADRLVLTALQSIPTYAPRNDKCTLAALAGLEANLRRDEQLLHEAEQAAADARLRLVASAWAFHEAALAAKVEIVSQFGNDSYEVRVIGLIPRSERKRPVRRKADEQ